MARKEPSKKPRHPRKGKGDPAPAPRRRLLRPTELAREIGLTREAVAKMRDNGLPHAAKDSKGYLYDPDEVRIWRAQNVRPPREVADRSLDADTRPATLNDARIELTIQQAALAALKRKQLEGELVEKDRVVSELGILLGAARALIDSMPDSASREVCDAMGVAYADKGPLVREALRKVAVSLLDRLSNAADAADAMHDEPEA